MENFSIKKISKGYSKKWVFLVLLSFPHLKPGYISILPLWDSVFDFWRVISFLIIVIWLVLLRGKISKFSGNICLMEIYLVAITFIREGAIWNSLVDTASVISIVLLYDIVCQSRKVFFSSQLFCFEIVIYINLITEILYPDTLYISQNSLWVARKCWFLGYYNNHTKYFVPAILIALLYQMETGKKIRSYLLLIVIAISALLVWSGGVLVSLGAMLLVWLFMKNRTSIFHYYSYWLIHVIFFIGIVLLKFQDLFKWFIDEVLGKWNSLLLRVSLWDKCMGIISKYPIMGWGVQTGLFRELQTGFYWGAHCHNMLLEVLYQGGLIYLVWLTVIIIVAGRKVFKYRGDLENKIISIAFLGWCVATLVEPFMSAFLMGMFVIAYYYSNDVSYMIIKEAGHKKINLKWRIVK